MTLLELPIGAPFRYDNRNFYKGSRIEYSKLIPITSRYYHIYEVRERCLFLDDGFSLPEDTEIESLL